MSNPLKPASRRLAERLAGAIPQWIIRLKMVLIESLSSWIDHRASSKGAALAFYTLFP